MIGRATPPEFGASSRWRICPHDAGGRHFPDGFKIEEYATSAIHAFSSEDGHGTILAGIRESLSSAVIPKRMSRDSSHVTDLLAVFEGRAFSRVVRHDYLWRLR